MKGVTLDWWNIMYIKNILYIENNVWNIPRLFFSAFLFIFFLCSHPISNYQYHSKHFFLAAIKLRKSCWQRPASALLINYSGESQSEVTLQLCWRLQEEEASAVPINNVMAHKVRRVSCLINMTSFDTWLCQHPRPSLYVSLGCHILLRNTFPTQPGRDGEEEIKVDRRRRRKRHFPSKVGKLR